MLYTDDNDDKSCNSYDSTDDETSEEASSCNIQKNKNRKISTKKKKRKVRTKIQSLRKR